MVETIFLALMARDAGRADFDCDHFLPRAPHAAGAPAARQRAVGFVRLPAGGVLGYLLLGPLDGWRSAGARTSGWG